MSEQQTPPRPPRWGMSVVATLRQSMNTIRFIVSHPLNRGRELRAMARFAAWQVGTRLVPGPVVVPFVGEARLLVRRGMTGATGNVYTGLHELSQMAFVLHALRPSDRFIDVGANVGTYTILASAAVGCGCLSFEPILESYGHLVDNLRLNGVVDRVMSVNAALGAASGEVWMTTNLGPMNQVTVNGGGARVPVVTLDDQPIDNSPRIVKIDVEGYETEVVAGGERLLQSESTMSVVMELNGSGDRYGYDEVALHEKMVSWGYQAVVYDPMTRTLADAREGERSDTVVYVHDRALVAQRLRAAPRYRVHGTEL